MQGWTCEQYKYKAGMKIFKKNTQLWKNGRKERQIDYPTPAVYTADVGLSGCPFLYFSAIVTW